LRLQLRRAQAEAGDIVLLYADESEALTHPYLARVWARRGADLRIPAPGQSKKVAMMGVLDWLKRKLIVVTSRTKRSADFITLLETLDRLYGPKPGVRTKPAVIVLDNGPIHISKATQMALATRAHWLSVEWLPQRRTKVRSRRMRPSSTTSKWSGMTSKPSISPTKPSPTWTLSTPQSTAPSPT